MDNKSQDKNLVMYVCQSSERKVTKKVALDGYAYTKRGGKGDVAYWYCDQRKLCGASLTEKNGTFIIHDNSLRRPMKRGWSVDGKHSSHPPDFKRIEKEISTRARRLEMKQKRLARQAAEKNETEISPSNSVSLSPHPASPTDTKIDRFDNACTATTENDHSQSDNVRIDKVCGGGDLTVATIELDDDPLDSCENPVLIDTDGGIFDAWALSLAFIANKTKCKRLSNTDFEIVGITTVSGSTTASNAVKNVIWMMQETGSVSPMPVFKGMENSLLGQNGASPRRPSFFGSDGLGDPADLPPLMAQHISRVQTNHAVSAIIKLAEKYKGRLTILALGPLTNLAMAVKMKPEIRKYVKEIFVAGGNMEGVGNMTVNSEFNFFADPESAKIVLENFHSCPIYILPWETCLKSASTYVFRTSILGTLGTPLINLFNKIEESALKKHGDHWIAPDAIAVACFLNREIMRKKENYYCTVELQGKHTRGMMVVDKNFLQQSPANVTVITQVDLTAFEAMLVEAMTDNRDFQTQNYMQQQQHDHGHHIAPKNSFKLDEKYF